MAPFILVDITVYKYQNKLGKITFERKKKEK